MKIRISALAALVSAAALYACDDNPFNLIWVENPDTVELYVLSRPESNLLSALDVYSRIPKRLEAPTTGDLWDLAVDYRDGQFVWLPPGAMGIDSDAAVATLDGHSWLSAREAPADTTLYVGDAPIPISFEPIYVIRTRLHQGAWGGVCNYYGKIEVLATDSIVGTVRFQFDVNPTCNSRDLVPPD